MIVFAPNVRFGTKWPSMTSRWIRSAPGLLDAPDGVARLDEVGVEDARGDPRPAVGHGYSPTPTGDRLVAALAAQGGRALGDEPGAAAGDGGRRRLAGPLGGELAAGGADLLAAVAPDRRRDAGVAEGRREAPR